MMGMERKNCYKTSHTSTTSLQEWEETHVIKYQIPLQSYDGNGKETRYKTSHTSKV